jgi:hypothetical protein
MTRRGSGGVLVTSSTAPTTASNTAAAKTGASSPRSIPGRAMIAMPAAMGVATMTAMPPPCGVGTTWEEIGARQRVPRQERLQHSGNPQKALRPTMADPVALAEAAEILARVLSNVIGGPAEDLGLGASA